MPTAYGLRDRLCAVGAYGLQAAAIAYAAAPPAYLFTHAVVARAGTWTPTAAAMVLVRERIDD